MKPARMRVKMCGMTSTADIMQAIHIGVDAIGLIFYPKSARNVSISQAKQLLKDIPPFITVVAVLVNPEADFVEELVTEIPLQLLQFHGDESPDFCQEFEKPYIKAIHPQNSDDIFAAAKDYASAQALLFDSATTNSRGGTGTTFDWSIIPQQLDKAYILAGGLNEFNVMEAINACKPYAVDVCSGIEALPGVKDHLKMSRFINALGGYNE